MAIRGALRKRSSESLAVFRQGLINKSSPNRGHHAAKDLRGWNGHRGVDARPAGAVEAAVSCARPAAPLKLLAQSSARSMCTYGGVPRCDYLRSCSRCRKCKNCFRIARSCVSVVFAIAIQVGRQECISHLPPPFAIPRCG